MTRKEILETAESIVNGEREEQYGTPENNFRIIGKLWEAYLGARRMGQIEFETHDVAAMLALLKIARIASGQIKDDNWVDLAGYAACGGELQSKTAAQVARDTWPGEHMMNRQQKQKNLIEFEDDELDKILEFQRLEGLETVQEAIMASIESVMGYFVTPKYKTAETEATEE